MESEYFTIDKGHQAKGCEVLLSPDRMEVLMFMSGAGTIFGAGASPVEFKAGDCLLIPATYEGVMRFTDESQYLTIIS